MCLIHRHVAGGMSSDSSYFLRNPCRFQVSAEFQEDLRRNRSLVGALASLEVRPSRQGVCPKPLRDSPRLRVLGAAGSRLGQPDPEILMIQRARPVLLEAMAPQVDE